MTINFNVTGKERKALVQALSELTYSDPVYAGAPTFAYTVGDYTVDKSGVISYSDTVAPEAVSLLVQKLSEKGFVPEQSEDEASTESETDAPIPEEASDFTKTEAADSILDEASVPAEDAPAPVAVETPDVAPEHEEDAQPAEAETEATQGAETPDVAAEPAEEESPKEDAPEEAEKDDESADDAADTDDTHLTITIPRASLPDDVLFRLKQIVANKGILFKNALQAETLPIIVTDEEVSFPWFTLTGMEGEATAYAQFITALCQMAKEQKRVLDKPYNGDNDRFAMRIFMVRLGMKGADFALARKLMMKNLSGNSGWRYGAPAETIPIYWNDLTPEKQKELLEALGENGNYDVFPLAEIPVPKKEDADESV